MFHEDFIAKELIWIHTEFPKSKNFFRQDWAKKSQKHLIFFRLQLDSTKIREQTIDTFY